MAMPRAIGVTPTGAKHALSVMAGRVPATRALAVVQPPLWPRQLGVGGWDTRGHDDPGRIHLPRPPTLMRTGTRPAMTERACPSPPPRRTKAGVPQTASAVRTAATRSPLTLIRHLPAGGGDLVRRKCRDQFRHRVRETFLPRHLHHEPLLHRLVIAGAHRDLALDAVERDRLQRRPQLIGVDAAGLLDPGGQHE